jgi:hypothetical protein
MKLGRFATGAGGVERLDNPPQNSLEQSIRTLRVIRKCD